MGYGKGIRAHTHTQNTDRKRKGNRLELALNKKDNTSVLEHNIIQAYWQTRNSKRVSQRQATAVIYKRKGWKY